ncbi:hypothetical protein Back2_00500 [Nocardioides baekrokdamisoli]|uniref:Uncharacterized protein n=2 Tax=Nocardioides baekrokdamisoli TaxID=1804624 RepID=A0A3G9IUA2_9ACTN|nr:hypothetical protein Back2_00500 [Nocardioides baekrokdamisoli]
MEDPTPLALRLRPGVISTVCKDMGISRHRLARRMDVHAETLRRADSGETGSISGRFIASLMTVTDKEFDELFEIVEEGWELAE